MQCRWVGKNVNLYSLSKRIEEFYTRQGFETKLERSDDVFQITGVLKAGDKLRLFSASIRGNPNDFIVEFSSAKNPEAGRISVALIPLITMFGGGVFILDKLRSQDYYETLERAFWVFVEETVKQLTVS